MNRLAIKRTIRSVAAAALLLLPLACTWVKVQPGAENVVLKTEAEVGQCKLLGTATGKTRASVGFVSRSDRKVNTEVLNLARNEAASIGGNTLVTKTDLVDGRQTFSVYSCPGGLP